MKILIVDDNTAIQETIRDVLTDEGHNVRLADNVRVAVAKIDTFMPDLVILDSHLGDEEALHVISEAQEQTPGLSLKVIFLKNRKDIVPTDIPWIKFSIEKPFTAEQLIEAVRDLSTIEVEKEIEEQEEKRATSVTKRLLDLNRKKKDPVVQSAPVSNLDDHNVNFGTSYVMFEPYPDTVYKFIGLFDPNIYNIMVITTNKAKSIKERFSYGGMQVVALSSGKRTDSVDVRDLGTVTHTVRQFMLDSARPVIVFDNFGDIVKTDGLDQSLLMLQQLISGKTKMCTLAVSVDHDVLTDKDRRILLHNMVKYEWRK